MKQSRNRGRGNNSRKRSTTPAVICLPDTRRPLTPPRKEPEALRAFALPSILEPLVKSSPRNDIRKAKQKSQPANTAIALTKTLDEAASAALKQARARTETLPLPRNRALTLPNAGVVSAIRQWLRKMIMKPRKAALAVDTASAKTQVRALRVEVAQLQRSLDQLMAQLRQVQ